MYALPDGTPVTYIGDGHDGRTLGERGQLLTTSGRVAHVKWSSDRQITPHDTDDLAPISAHLGAARSAPRDELDDSLEVGTLQATGLRHVYDAEGEVGVLNALATAGQLGGLQVVAEEVQAFTETRIRQAGVLHTATGQLDEEEVDGLVRVAALALLRDAFGTLDE